GTDRARRLPLANVPDPIALWRAHGGVRDVVWHSGRAAALFCHGHQLCRTVQALSRSRLLLFLRRTSILVQDAVVQVRPRGGGFLRAGGAICIIGSSRVVWSGSLQSWAGIWRASSCPTPSAALISAPCLCIFSASLSPWWSDTSPFAESTARPPLMWRSTSFR